MFSTSHAAVGTLIGSLCPIPWLAFVLGFISHFIFDIIPHGDEHGDIDDQKYFRRVAVQALIDSYSLFFLFLIFTASDLIVYTPAMAWGIFGSLLPDIIMAGTLVLKFLNKESRILNGFRIFHLKIQHIFPQGNLLIGIMNQLLVMIAVYGILFYYVL